MQRTSLSTELIREIWFIGNVDYDGAKKRRRNMSKMIVKKLELGVSNPYCYHTGYRTSDSLWARVP